MFSHDTQCPAKCWPKVAGFFAKIKLKTEAEAAAEEELLLRRSSKMRPLLVPWMGALEARGWMGALEASVRLG